MSLGPFDAFKPLWEPFLGTNRKRERPAYRRETWTDMLACNCVGPQPGQPVCPCQMRNVQIRDGRYVIIRDLGPVLPEQDEKWSWSE